MSQFEAIPSPGYGFQGSRVRRALAACKTLGMLSKQALPKIRLQGTWSELNHHAAFFGQPVERALC